MSEIMNDRDRITKWLSKIDLGWLKSEQQRLSKKDTRTKVVTLADKYALFKERS